ncbi:hypothetical protein ACN2XU_15525 [Primorskyibacter sp. 2E107]|uniref:hypothetical protein n=1 Tax=Primorskyibacter sp. 2E107 TaxID=3403458 RepID=UPI003AF86C97
MKKTSRLAAFLCGLLLTNGASAPAHAQEEFLLEAGKAVVVFGIKQLASAAYDSSCRNGASTRPAEDAGGDLICMAVGSALGKSEEEFRRDMRAGLENLNAGIARIEERLDELKAGQAALQDAIGVVAMAVDLIPAETEAHRNLVKIRAAWRDQFKGFLNGSRDFNAERSVAFARELVFASRIAQSLSLLNETLVGRAAGDKPPLIEQQFNHLMAKLALKEDVDLDTAYLLFSSIMESLQLEQARGEIMYAWAAAILEAHCAETGDCAAARDLPHTTEEFRVTALRHRVEQLTMFNRLVERMVLARSDLHSLEANFLHHDAELLFASADLFTAIQLREGFGIRGRVISAGSAFDGTVTIGGRVLSAGKPTRQQDPRKPVMPPRLNGSTQQIDWWTKPANAVVYDTVHFTDSWTTYDIADSSFSLGSHAVTTALPWVNGPVEVRRIDLSTGRVATDDSLAENVVEFGSFLAIARAGGAYAMMHEAWDVGRQDSPAYAKGTNTAPQLSQLHDGMVVYASKSVRDTSARVDSVERNREIKRIRNVTFADGGTVTVHMKSTPPGMLYPGAQEDEINADAPLNGALNYFTDYKQDVFKLASSRFSLHTSLLFIRDRGYNGFYWDVSKEPTSPTAGAVTMAPVETRSFQVSDGEELRVKLASRVNFEIATSGFDATRYRFFTGIAPTEVYVTRE